MLRGGGGVTCPPAASQASLALSRSSMRIAPLGSPIPLASTPSQASPISLIISTPSFDPLPAVAVAVAAAAAVAVVTPVVAVGGTTVEAPAEFFECAMGDGQCRCLSFDMQVMTRMVSPNSLAALRGGEGVGERVRVCVRV